MALSTVEAETTELASEVGQHIFNRHQEQDFILDDALQAHHCCHQRNGHKPQAKP